MLQRVCVRFDGAANDLIKSNFSGDLVGEARLEWVEEWMQVKTFERLGSDLARGECVVQGEGYFLLF